jgi:hypothetical protein
LIPSGSQACAITEIPAASASSTMTATFSGRKLDRRGSSHGETTPPLAATLITFAPARISSRTFRRTSSRPSTTPTQELRME